MIKLKNFILIFSNTPRSFAYFYHLKKNNLLPKYLIYLDNQKKAHLLNNYKYFKKLNIKKECKKSKIFFAKFNTSIIDNPFVLKLLKKIKLKKIIYSGYPSCIIKNENLLKQKILIHTHSGKLPEFKGSTTIFYSILLKKKIFCTTFRMSSNIDSGKILFVQEYPIPKRRMEINSIYDEFIRAQNLVSYLKSRKKTFKIKKNKDVSYFISHPIIRYLALRKKIS